MKKKIRRQKVKEEAWFHVITGQSEKTGTENLIFVVCKTSCVAIDSECVMTSVDGNITAFSTLVLVLVFV